jgi:primase-polymerase (primpol)-like protein
MLMQATLPPPEPLAVARRWLLWRWVERDGKQTKVPCYIDGVNRHGDLNADAHRLVSHAEAAAAYAMWGDTMAGIGFALGDGWQGIDLDKLAIHPGLLPLVEQLPGYVEYSPSGDGVHSIGRGEPFQAINSKPVGIEAYSGGRFFTFTGRIIRNAPLIDLGPFVRDVLRHMLPAPAPSVPVVPPLPTASVAPEAMAVVPL